jgi:hypothetical protein
MEDKPVDLYRGCICALLIGFIAALSLILASVLGLFGLLFPSLAVGFCYLVVDTVIVELMWWDRDHNG